MKNFQKLYEKAQPLKAEGLRDGYKRLIDYDGIVLAMRKMQDAYEFVTWLYTHDGEGVTLGHYFTDLKAAEEDFAVRAGLINANLLFAETDLKLIHASLVGYVGLNENLCYKDEKAIGSILEKIELLVPEILRHNGHEDLELVSDDGMEL